MIKHKWLFKENIFYSMIKNWNIVLINVYDVKENSLYYYVKKNSMPY